MNKYNFSTSIELFHVEMNLCDVIYSNIIILYDYNNTFLKCNNGLISLYYDFQKASRNLIGSNLVSQYANMETIFYISITSHPRKQKQKQGFVATGFCSTVSKGFVGSMESVTVSMCLNITLIHI